MTNSGLALKKFWFICFLVTLVAGILGLLAVGLDRFLLHEQLFNNGQLVVFLLLIFLSVLIWQFIYPKYRYLTFEKESTDHNQSL